MSESPSDWKESARWRQENREWLRVSGMVMIAFYKKHGTGQDAKDLIMKLIPCNSFRYNDILAGRADLSLSEINSLVGLGELQKILEYISEKKKTC